MTKTLTEQYFEGTLKEGEFWVIKNGCEPSTIYLFNSPASRRCIKAKRLKIIAPVPSYDEYQRLVSNSDESVQKIHILNEQNTKHYNELCEEIKKNNLLEKKLAIATKALKYYDGLENIIIDWKLLTGQEAGTARKALKEMEGVK